VKEELIRYKPGLDPKPEDKTDWERVRNMTDEEVKRLDCRTRCLVSDR
jgi:hypothetical protein